MTQPRPHASLIMNHERVRGLTRVEHGIGESREILGERDRGEIPDELDGLSEFVQEEVDDTETVKT